MNDVELIWEEYRKVNSDYDLVHKRAYVSRDEHKAKQLIETISKQNNWIKAYHGTDKKFNRFIPSESGYFGRGIYVTKNLIHAKAFGTLLEVFVKLENPWIYREHEPSSEEEDPWTVAWGKYAERDRTGVPLYKNKKLLSQRLRTDGYDGVMAPNEIVVFNPNKIKLADPFTFDDDGELIPISRRFDMDTDDIRY